jgi:glycerophosphoryl diester phosphodiesterase
MAEGFDLQGHRGACGLKPENTLPAFEVAFDLGVTSVETDIHLTRDGVPILFHDPAVSDRLCRLLPGSDAAAPALQPPVASLTLAQMRCYRADANPDPQRFPEQNADVTPLAEMFAERQGIDPFTPPALADLLSFTLAYAGEPGRLAGKSPEQRSRAGAVRFDLELKRVPFRPETIGDGFNGSAPGTLEIGVHKVVQAAGMLNRVVVRSFDHRSVSALRRLKPALATAIIVVDAPVSLVKLAAQAGAKTYCPAYRLIDEAQVRQAHASGIRVLPWTVNEPADWERLLQWGVDGICTDYPDRLAVFLKSWALEDMESGR